MVLALSAVLAARKAAAAATSAAASRLPEQALEEIAELSTVGVGVAAAGELEALVPIGRRTEILPLLPVGAELVVGGALLRILQDLISLARVLELGFGVRFLVHVRMIGARQLAVGALDVVLAGVAVDAEDFVVVLIFHGATRSSGRPAEPPP